MLQYEHHFPDALRTWLPPPWPSERHLARYRARIGVDHSRCMVVWLAVVCLFVAYLSHCNQTQLPMITTTIRV
jgi:hypothetical protein